MIPMIINPLEGLLLLLAGLALGGLFYGGLWFTIAKGFHARNASLWFLLSMLLRNVGVVLGFYLLSEGKIPRLIICLLGFVLFRLLFSRWVKSSTEFPPQEKSL